VFSDIWGHAQTSVSGHNYYVSLTHCFRVVLTLLLQW
jgi:hypothetical protein